MTSPAANTSGFESRSGSLRAAIDAGEMSRLQWIAVAMCTALNALDGFDVLVIAFTSSYIIKDWGLTGTQFGLLASAGLFGMAAGSLFLAPWADRFGRRAIILLCLALMTTGMLLSATAQAPSQPFWLRVLTGIGIGGLLASIGVITAEYSSVKWRGTNVSIQATGYPVGATFGGLIAAVLIERYGWRSAFVFGGLLSLVMIPLVLRWLPESMDFLIARRPPRALERLNSLLRRMGREEARELPAPTATEAAVSGNVVRGLQRLFNAETARSTLLIWSSFFLLMFSFYFIMSWTPRLLEAAGLSAQQGIQGGVWMNAGGIVGGSLFAVLAARFRLSKLTSAFLTLTAAATIVFAFVLNEVVPAFLVAVAIGVVMVASMAGLYSLAPILYPASVRTTGVGWGIGIGRIGAILAPIIAGMLADSGWTTTQLYLAFALPLIAASITAAALRK
jgi:benzoate transport